jgi:uncharacterized protein YigE (DUF2233 family)
MMTGLSRAALLVLLSAAPIFAQSPWKIAETHRESSPNESVEHWTTKVEETATADRATLHLAVFATRTATLRIIDQPGTPRTDLASAMPRVGALAGVNGGYFDPEDAPVGLLVSEGRVLSPLRKAKLLTGVLWTTQTQVDIVRATRFTMNKKVKSAVQCGPLLIERGSPVPGLNDTRPARRSFAAVDGEGHALIGASSAVTLAQLSRSLSLPNLAGKMKISRALNLDGGSSTAFWFAGKEEAFSIPESKIVRDFVAVVPR